MITPDRSKDICTLSSVTDMATYRAAGQPKRIMQFLFNDPFVGYLDGVEPFSPTVNTCPGPTFAMMGLVFIDVPFYCHSFCGFFFLSSHVRFDIP